MPAFGRTDSHLHQFYVGGLTIGAPEAIEDAAYGLQVFEATDAQLKDLTFPYEVDASLNITYQYDFGDNWQHTLVLRSHQLLLFSLKPRAASAALAEKNQVSNGASRCR